MAYRSYEDHIADLIIAKSASSLRPYRRYAQTPRDWDITVAKMLDAPNRQITVYRSGGLAKNPRWLIDYPSIQVKVRGGPNDYQLCDAIATELLEYLVGAESYDAVNGDRIVSITAIGDVTHTGWDDSKRPEFTFNLRLIAEPNKDNIPGSNRDPL